MKDRAMRREALREGLLSLVLICSLFCALFLSVRLLPEGTGAETGPSGTPVSADAEGTRARRAFFPFPEKGSRSARGAEKPGEQG
ncbi:MAG: hypothetical protein J5849_00105 [Clostridia bacterium]|nr:hypothetical protein [Clostridia bacterium]